MSVIKATLSAAALALAAPYLYSRGQLLATFYHNAPGRLAEVRIPGASYDVRFADRVRSCEDVIFLEEQGLAIMGCDPGRERHNTVMGVFMGDPVPEAELYVFDYAATATADDDQALRRLELVGYEPGIDIHSLGMTFDEKTQILYVANHRREGGARIDCFNLDLEAGTATHVRSLKHELIRGPNSMVLAEGGKGLYVTNDHRFLMKDSRMLSQIETYLALPLGTVVYVDLTEKAAVVDEDDEDGAEVDETAEEEEEEEEEMEDVHAEIVATLPYANGIELLNATTAAVASTSDASVYLYEVMGSEFVGGGTPVWTYKRKIKVPFMPDNLHHTSSGSLLIAGHPHVPSLMKFAASRWACNGSPDEFAKADEVTKKYCGSSDEGTGSFAMEWRDASDGGEESLRTLYSGVEYPSSATAARDDSRGVGIIAGLYAKGILVWRE